MKPDENGFMRRWPEFPLLRVLHQPGTTLVELRQLRLLETGGDIIMETLRLEKLYPDLFEGLS